VDVLLVGDSVGVVMLGYEDTLAVTPRRHAAPHAGVARGTSRALVVADMPFMTYQVSVEEAVRNAGRLIQAGAAAVKVEGGPAITGAVRRLVEVGIPVMGHLGLRPQSVHQMGGYHRQAVQREDIEALVEDARALERAGVFAIVLEAVGHDAAQLVTAAVTVPTIGIGAGPHCDGQVLVSPDMLGLFDGQIPSFAKQYVRLVDDIRRRRARVRRRRPTGRFPEVVRPARNPRSPDRLAGQPMPLRVVQTIDEVRAALTARRESGAIGLVPTMGALHAGHARLVERRARRVRHVVVSIFINPLQFDRADDLARYPRPLEADLALCERLGVDAVFAPSAGRDLSRAARCARARRADREVLVRRVPAGHFDGVATVVLKLFDIVQPGRGLLRREGRAAARHHQAHGGRPERAGEDCAGRDGARTRRPGPELAQPALERRRARPGSSALPGAHHRANGHIGRRRRGKAAVKRDAAATIPADERLRLEYLELVDPRTFQPVERVTGPVVAAGALWVGSTRLIDQRFSARPP
jgi:3-methyl-2-oxobutanoate hydroxymethyltransferase